MIRLSLTAAAAVFIAGCATANTTIDHHKSGKGAHAVLKNAGGKVVGKATAWAMGDHIMVKVAAKGLTPGVHGVHVHTTGLCEGPKFTTAGGHWNPGARKHGSENPEGPHAGDLPNITVSANGTGAAQFALPGGTYAGLLDSDGASLVIHAGPDDYKTDPAGNSGDRIVCGIFAAK